VQKNVQKIRFNLPDLVFPQGVYLSGKKNDQQNTPENKRGNGKNIGIAKNAKQAGIEPYGEIIMQQWQPQTPEKQGEDTPALSEKRETLVVYLAFTQTKHSTPRMVPDGTAKPETQFPGGNIPADKTGTPVETRVFYRTCSTTRPANWRNAENSRFQRIPALSPYRGNHVGTENILG
jgi:hypothetical protein